MNVSRDVSNHEGVQMRSVPAVKCAPHLNVSENFHLLLNFGEEKQPMHFELISKLLHLHWLHSTLNAFWSDSLIWISLPITSPNSGKIFLNALLNILFRKYSIGKIFCSENILLKKYPAQKIFCLENIL